MNLGSLFPATAAVDQLNRLHGLPPLLAADHSALLLVHRADDVADDFVVVRAGPLILAVAVRPVYPLHALGEGRAFDVPVLDLVQVRAADFYDAALAEERDAAL